MKELKEIIGNYDLFLIDLWGVIWLGGEGKPIEHASSFINYLLEQNKKFYFLSNTVWPEKKLAEMMNRMGAPVSKEHFLTAGRAAIEKAKELKGAEEIKFFHVGKEWEVEAYFSSLNVTQNIDIAELLFVGDFNGSPGKEPSETLKTLNAILSRKDPITVYVCNPDDMSQQPDGTFNWESGHYMREMEKKHRHHEYIFIGKPFLPIYEYAFNLHPGIPKERTAMIGDTVMTDMVGAENAGIKTILVGTGNTKEMPKDFLPDHFLKNLRVE